MNSMTTTKNPLSWVLDAFPARMAEVIDLDMLLQGEASVGAGGLKPPYPKNSMEI